MAKLFLAILIVLLGLGVELTHAQSGALAEAKAPVEVLAQKWFQLSDLRRTTSGGTWQSQTGPPSQVSQEVQRDDWKVVKRFVFEGKFKNASGRKLLGFAWDYVIYDKDNVTELDRKKFVYANSLNKNKTISVRANSSIPPNVVINAKNLGDQAKTLERIEIRCVVYEDKTNWIKTGFDEKACEDLRLNMARREERKRIYGY